MKKLYKIIALFLAIGLLFTACAPKTDTKDDKKAAKVSATKVDSKDKAKEEPKEEAKDKKEEKSEAKEEKKDEEKPSEKEEPTEEVKEEKTEESKEQPSEEKKEEAKDEKAEDKKEDSKETEKESEKEAKEDSKAPATAKDEKKDEKAEEKVEESEKETEAPTEDKKAEETQEAKEEPSEEKKEDSKAPAAAKEEKKEEASEEVKEEETEAPAEEEKPVEEEKVEKLPEIKIGLATDVGGVDDKSFNEGTWDGVLKYAKAQELSEDNYQYVQATSDADYIPQLTTFAEMDLDLIIAPGFLFKDAITEVAETFPEQNFLFIDDESEAPNVKNAVFSEHEGSFLVGVAAALKAEEAGQDKVGFVGGMDFETIQKFEAGFEQGVHAVNPDIEVVVEYVGGFDLPEEAQALATKMYDSGVYIIYPAAGASGNGVIKEAKDRALNGKDVWVVGVDKDQYEEGIYEDDKSVILTSMVKRMDNVVYQVCQEVAKGEFKGGTQVYGLKDDGVGIPEENPNLKDEWVETIQDYIDKIVNEEIEVSPLPSRLAEEVEEEAEEATEEVKEEEKVEETKEAKEEPSEEKKEEETEAAKEEKAEDKKEDAKEDTKAPAAAKDEKAEEEVKETDAPAEDEKVEETEEVKEEKAEEAKDEVDEEKEEAKEEEKEEAEEEPAFEDYPLVLGEDENLKKLFIAEKDKDAKEIENVGFFSLEKATWVEEEDDFYTNVYPYIRLNDLAAALAGSKANFNPVFDEKANTLSIKTGEDYKADKKADLVEREVATEYKDLAEDFKVTVNDEELAPETVDAILVNDDIYFQIGSLRRALGRIYHNKMDMRSGELTIYPFPSDIPQLTTKEFDELCKGNDTTVVFAWATWCSYCNDEFTSGNVSEFVEYIKDKDIKVINLVGDGDNWHRELLEEEIGLKENEQFQFYALNNEIVDHFYQGLMGKEHPLWFPTIIFADANGEKLAEYNAEEGFSWVELHEQLMEEAFEEAAEESEEKVEESKEEIKEEEKKEDKVEESTKEAKKAKVDKKEDKLPEIKIGFAADGGGISDKSFNQASWEGILKYAEDQELGKDKYHVIQAPDVADFLPSMTTLAEMDLDLIVTGGFLFKEAVAEAAEEFPEQNFLFVDDVIEAPNVKNAVFAEHEGSFLAGVVAALKADAAKKDKVAFVGGMDFITVQKFEAGFEQGVNAVNPDIEVVVEYVGGFQNAEDAQAIATKLYDSGVYIIFHAAGSSGNGVIKEAKDRALNGDEVWVIGVDMDQYAEGIYQEKDEKAKKEEKSVILTSMVKRIDTAVYAVCEEVAKGEFQAGTQVFTLKDDGVGLPQENPNLDEDILKAVKEFTDKIVSGEIEVSEVPERIEAEKAKEAEKAAAEEKKAEEAKEVEESKEETKEDSKDKKAEESSKVKETEKATEKVTEKQKEKDTEKVTEKETEKDKETEKETEEATEKETEKATEKVTEKQTKKKNK